MKTLRFLAPVAILAAALSCGNNPKSGNKAGDPVEAVDNRPLVYSSAYDGYTNIREAASSKAAVLGKFRNGPVGAVVLGREGNWTKVEYQGISGYVYSKYISDTPTREVLVGVDGDWLEGIWRDPEDIMFYTLIFNNGQYATFNTHFNEAGAWFEYGIYNLEGTDIVFSMILGLDTENYEYVRYRANEITDRCKIVPSADKIGNMVRVKYTSDQEYKAMMDGVERDFWDYYALDGCYITKSLFNKVKQEVATKLK